MNKYLPFSSRKTKVPESPPLVPKSEEISPVEHMWNSLKIKLVMIEIFKNVYTYSLTNDHVLRHSSFDIISTSTSRRLLGLALLSSRPQPEATAACPAYELLGSTDKHRGLTVSLNTRVSDRVRTAESEPVETSPVHVG